MVEGVGFGGYHGIKGVGNEHSYKIKGVGARRVARVRE